MIPKMVINETYHLLHDYEVITRTMELSVKNVIESKTLQLSEKQRNVNKNFSNFSGFSDFSRTTKTK